MMTSLSAEEGRRPRSLLGHGDVCGAAGENDDATERRGGGAPEDERTAGGIVVRREAGLGHGAGLFRCAPRTQDGLVGLGEGP